MSAPVGYWRVDDIKAKLETFVKTGAQPKQAISDVGGNVTGLIQLPAGG